MNNLRETHSRVSRAISDKEFELAAAQEKINALSQLVRHDATAGGNSSSAEVETLVREKEAVQQQVVLLRQERDQLVTALQQTQVENEQLQGKVGHASVVFRSHISDFFYFGGSRFVAFRVQH